MMSHIQHVFVAIFAIHGFASATSTLNRCFERFTRRAIDNYPPLAEYQMESLTACADYCIMAAGNGNKKDPLCRSFTYNIAQRTCQLYDHDGMKVPAILYPAIGTDFYKRSEEMTCKSTTAFDVNNRNFVRLGSVEEKVYVTEESVTATTVTEIESSSENYRSFDIPNDVDNVLGGNDKVIEMKAPKEPNMAKPRKEICLTSSAYYVVIGNEIVRPISNGGEVKVFNDVDQGHCASFCSNNQGPDHEELTCSSLNYFPLSRKCELYSILAEPHGPGSLVENQDVIYAEKFCLPEAKQNCQNDEIFILHVQKSLSGIPINQESSDSITSCLRSCLNTHTCKTAVFDSMKQQCHSYKESISSSEESIVETPPGFVMIENGCAGSKRTRSDLYYAKISKEESSSESEWSECNFRVNGVRVKVRTTEEGKLETAAC